MKKVLIKILATAFGLGYAPTLSGTLGTFVGIPLFWGLSHLDWPLYFLATLLFTIFAIVVANAALPLLRDTKKPADPSQIVIDEVAGFLWAGGIVRYLGFWKPSEGFWWLILFAFIFFRIFDAAKWGPVGWAERRWHGGFGIVIDDVVAGIVAGFVSIFFCIFVPFVVFTVQGFWS
ncbi:MAG: hypothetical protein A3H42_03135 [Deltaproteobacteria bacterium RIFCSPLOWO2_02_FULL_46_8]|nr:MAG: hypothetical protein A3H42_03135 [Deltaproteobacteria bacterium RIFCSPLOWO2_02_FULL_46_8]